MTIKQLIWLRTVNLGFVVLSFAMVGILNSIYAKEFENDKEKKTQTLDKKNVQEEIDSKE